MLRPIFLILVFVALLLGGCSTYYVAQNPVIPHQPPAIYSPPKRAPEETQAWHVETPDGWIWVRADGTVLHQHIPAAESGFGSMVCGICGKPISN